MSHQRLEVSDFDMVEFYFFPNVLDQGTFIYVSWDRSAQHDRYLHLRGFEVDNGTISYMYHEARCDMLVNSRRRVSSAFYRLLLFTDNYLELAETIASRKLGTTHDEVLHG